jgi:hypothetical protein
MISKAQRDDRNGEIDHSEHGTVAAGSPSSAVYDGVRPTIDPLSLDEEDRT